MNPQSASAPAARCGKIARLPVAIRDQVNRRLENNEPAAAVLPWLNGLAETKQILAEQFNHIPISPQNLSDWRQGGFREWLLRRELVEHAESLTETAFFVQGRNQPQALIDNLALVLTARYAALLNSWDGSVTAEFEAQLRVLRALNHDIVQLQRSLHRAAEQNLQAQREQEEKRALEMENERNRKVLALAVADDYRDLASRYCEREARVRAARRHQVPLDEVALFCGPPPSSRIVPNQGAALNTAGDTPAATCAAAGSAP
jgi:hypothetical protein